MDDADEEDLSRIADEAIGHIREKQYETDLKAGGINEIQLYGIAFSRKKAAVKKILISQVKSEQ